MKPTLLAALLFLATSLFAQTDADRKQIVNILSQQTASWNKGDIESFMKGYWNSDSVMFIGKSGVTYGYKNVLQNYKKNYSDTTQMGKLRFEILKVQTLSPVYSFVVGRWFVKRSVGDISGHFTLLFRKINGSWVIVSDHSS